MIQHFTKDELKIILKALHHEKGIADADVCIAESSLECQEANDYFYKLLDIIKKCEECLTVREEMKKSDLQTGMAIVTRDCDYFEVTENYNGEKFIENRLYRIPLSSYTDDMIIDADDKTEYKHKHDIYKVYTPHFKELLYKRGE